MTKLDKIQDAVYRELGTGAALAVSMAIQNYIPTDSDRKEYGTYALRALSSIQCEDNTRGF